MSGRIEFTTLTDDDAFEAPHSGTIPKSKSGEITPLKDLNAKKQDFRSRAEGLQFMVLLFVIASFCITVALAVEIVIGESQVPSHGAVSSLSGTCSDVGVSILKRNGNAVDAAIGAMICLMVVEPQASGFGGGGFIVIHDHKNKDHPASVLDFRESAPQDIVAANGNNGNEMRSKFGLRVGVPGELLGMFEASKAHGHLTWSELFLPAIRIAEDGFPVSARLAKVLKRRVAKERVLPASFFNVFRNPATNKLYEEGEIMHRKDLANLFRKVSTAEGVLSFYTGNIAEEIVQEVQKNGGVMKLDDLKNYRVRSNISPIVGKFLNYTVVTMPAPSSGSLLLYTLKSVETLDVDNPLSTLYMTTLTKITKSAYVCRSLLGDPYQNPKIRVSESLIANRTVTGGMDVCENLPRDSIPVDDHGTAHVSAIDKNEMLVSFTSSLNNLFGSMIVTPSGILLNDELLDFSNDPGEKFNFIRPNKRPLSSMVPTIVYQENRPCLLRLSIGGINGTRTLSSVAQTIINMVKFGMDPKKAVDAPKIYCDRDSCEIERFDGVENFVHELKIETGIENFQIVEEKLAGIGVTSKSQTKVQAYFDSSIDGKASQY